MIFPVGTFNETKTFYLSIKNKEILKCFFQEIRFPSFTRNSLKIKDKMKI